MEILSLKLKEKNIKPTTNRLIVAQVLFAERNHFSAEEIWALVKKRYPYVSRATVYNVLDLFSEKGLIKRRVMANKNCVYDAIVSPHHHFIDEKSGRIYDIPYEKVALPENINLKGFEVTDFYLVIKGVKK